MEERVGKKESLRRICIAPGPDGFGPSTIASQTAHALARRLNERGINSQFIVQTAHRDFNATLYQDRPGTRVVECVHGIRLGKNGGGVDPKMTYEMVCSYLNQVKECRQTCSSLDGVDLAISVGAPHVLHEASWRGIPAVEVFDHSWCETLTAILMDAGLYDMQAASVIGGAVRHFEEHADRVYLFPEFIAPRPFVAHWIATTPNAVGYIPGVFGPHPDPRRQTSIHQLAITRESPTVFLTGGGTPVWDCLLRAVYDEVQSHRGNYMFNVVLPHPDKTRGTFAVLACDGRTREIPRSQLPSLRNLLAACDLIVSRAGAGIVMDAIACRIPFLAVPEPAQLQVEAIRHQLLRRGLAYSPDLPAFDCMVASCGSDASTESAAHELLGSINDMLRQGEVLQGISRRMRAIATDQEDQVAEDIVSRFLTRADSEEQELQRAAA